MKKMFLISLGMVCMTVVIAQVIASNHKPADLFHAGKAVFTWAHTTHDFGKVKLNNPVTNEFSFTNTGDAHLVILTAKASCGCTVTEYTKIPIEPGAKGFVKATYNAATLGVFSKTVTINANTEEGMVQLTIKGEVIE